MADRGANQDEETDAAAKIRVANYKKSDGTKVSDYERTRPGKAKSEGKPAGRNRGEKRQTREGEADEKSEPSSSTKTPPPVHPSGDPKEPEFKK